MRTLTDEYPDRMMVGEVGENMRPIEVMAEYTSGGDKLHLAYSFEFLWPDHTAGHFRSRIENFFRKAPDGWPCWSFSNHDVTRHATRWTKPGGDVDAVAKQSIAMLASFPGTLGLYQGEELGQLETDIEFHELRDLGYVAFWPEIKGRDGCRTPMAWEADQTNAGFSTGVPWLPVKEPQAARAVDLQEARNDSVLHAYRSSLAFRRATDALRLGATEFLDLPEPILGIRRSHGGQHLTCLFNLSERPLTLTLSGEAHPVGPSQAEVEGATVSLPAHGYAYLESAAPITVAPEALGEPGSHRQPGMASAT